MFIMLHLGTMDAKRSSRLARIDKKNLKELEGLRKQAPFPTTLTRMVNMAVEFGIEEMRKMVTQTRK